MEDEQWREMDAEGLWVSSWANIKHHNSKHWQTFAKKKKKIKNGEMCRLNSDKSGFAGFSLERVPAAVYKCFSWFLASAFLTTRQS